MKFIDSLERVAGIKGVLVAVALISIGFKYILIRTGLEVGNLLPDNVILILSLAGPTSVGAVIATATDLLYGTSGLVNQIAASAINLVSSGRSLDRKGGWSSDLKDTVAAFTVMAYRALRFGENGFKSSMEELETIFLKRIVPEMQDAGWDNSLAFLMGLKSEMVTAYLAAEERLEREIFPTQIITSVLSLGILLVVVLFSKTDNIMIGLLSSAIVAVIGSMWLLTVFYSDERRGHIQGRIAANVTTLLRALETIGAPEAVADAQKFEAPQGSPALVRIRQTVHRIFFGFIVPIIIGLLLIALAGAGIITFKPSTSSPGTYFLLGLAGIGVGLIMRIAEKEMGNFFLGAIIVVVPVLMSSALHPWMPGLVIFTWGPLVWAMFKIFGASQEI